MPEEPKKHEGLMDKVFHHGHKKEEGEQSTNKQEAPKQGESKKLEGEFKEYMKEDKQMSEEGKEYGGLM